jgi:hypothetical protein
MTSFWSGLPHRPRCSQGTAREPSRRSQAPRMPVGVTCGTGEGAGICTGAGSSGNPEGSLLGAVCRGIVTRAGAIGRH